MKVRAVLRFAGDISQIRTMDGSVGAGELASVVKDISKRYLSDWDELIAVEWHVGNKLPCDENLLASFDRRSLGLFGYDFDSLCLANVDRPLDYT